MAGNATFRIERPMTDPEPEAPSVGGGSVRDAVLCAICVVLGGLFVFSGAAKILQPYDFLSSLYSYRLFSRPVGVALAVFVPPLEAVVGFGLLSVSFRRGALILSTALSVCFLSVRTVAVRSGLEVDCNCLGSATFGAPRTLDWTGLVFSSLLLAASAAALVLSLRGARARSAPEASLATRD